MAIKEIDYEVCTNCERCYEICPLDVYRKVGNVAYVAYPEDCMACYLCVLDCPVDAITVTPERSREIVQCW